MLLKEQCDQSVTIKPNDDVCGGFLLSHPGTGSFETNTLARITLHVVAQEYQQRAAMARLIRSAGHRVEVYSCSEELVRHRPAKGVILKHDSGIHCTARACSTLASAGLWLPVIGFGEDISPASIVEGMKAGATDYLFGEISSDTLSSKILQWGVEADAVFNRQKRRAVAQAALSKLTMRERQVLDLLVKGQSNKGIACKLEISPRTVEAHRMKVFAKLGATSAAHAVSIRLDALDG